MENICAYFDVQGYTVNGKFHPLEATMFGDTSLVHVSVGKTCNCQPSESEMEAMEDMDLFIHGLESSEGGLTFNQLEQLTKTFLPSCRRERKLVVAVKSKQSADLLEFFGIPYVNISDRYMTKGTAVENRRRPCYLHNINGKHIRCSLNIVQDMITYMISFENGINVID